MIPIYPPRGDMKEECDMPHTHTKAVVHRLSRVIGHLQAIRDMVEDDRDCCEVLTQLAAVKSAINGISREVLKDHIEHCVADAVREGDAKALEDLSNALDRFMK